jgi:hypothetical protein
VFGLVWYYIVKVLLRLLFWFPIVGVWGVIYGVGLFFFIFGGDSLAKSFSGLGATICDAAADLPSSPIEGLIVFQKDTNELKIYDGSVWVSVLDTDTPPACSLLYNNTFSNSAGFTINNVFNSSFRSYRLVYSITSGNTSGSNTFFQLRSGSTNIASGYYNRLWYFTGTSPATAVQDNVAQWEWMMYHANIISSGHIDFYNPAVAAGKTVSWSGSAWGGANNITFMGNGYNGNTSVCDGLNITAYGNNISGIIKIYGFRESI